MLSKKVLLIGKGHLGSYLKDLWKIPSELHWTREMAELDMATLKKLQPQAVINTAGKTELRWCEDNPAECFRCNVSAPVGVYRAVKQAFNNTVPYIHLSSGCVWDGPYRPDGKPFGPNDPAVPACFYAWTKAACDALMMDEAAAPILILRPRQVYSPLASPRNTLTKLNTYPKLLDTPNSMTSADTIARTIEIALNSSDKKVWNRILNVYERNPSSPFEVGTLLAQAGCRKPPEKLAKSELDTWHKPKRVDAVIEDPFFEELVKPPTVQEELKRNIALYARAISK
ncbi:MAG TPA: sugar nucleotide-binding protein [Planctomycetota bacterium]|nr:sugar nucleotide-binding protein [Planctomycetota bacterium]